MPPPQPSPPQWHPRMQPPRGSPFTRQMPPPGESFELRPLQRPPMPPGFPRAGPGHQAADLAQPEGVVVNSPAPTIRHGVPISRSSISDKTPNYQAAAVYLQPVLLIAIISLAIFLAVGSVTDSIAGIYILSLRYRQAQSAEPVVEDRDELTKLLYDHIEAGSNIRELRVGYLGMCAQTINSAWVCSRSAADLVSKLRKAHTTDSLNLIWIGNKFKDEAVTPIFAFLTIVSATMSLILDITSRVEFRQKLLKVNNKNIRRLIKLSSANKPWLSGLLHTLTPFAAFNMAFWQHQASAISLLLIDSLAGTATSSRAGPGALALCWLILCLALVSLGTYMFEERIFAALDLSSDSEAASTIRQDSSFDGEDQGFWGPRRHPAARGPQQTSAPPPMARSAMDYVSGFNPVRREVPAADRRRHTSAWDRNRRLPPTGFVEEEEVDETDSTEGSHAEQAV